VLGLEAALANGPAPAAATIAATGVASSGCGLEPRLRNLRLDSDPRRHRGLPVGGCEAGGGCVRVATTGVRRQPQLGAADLPGLAPDDRQRLSERGSIGADTEHGDDSRLELPDPAGELAGAGGELGRGELLGAVARRTRLLIPTPRPSRCARSSGDSPADASIRRSTMPAPNNAA
jgi:hypothetical protein